MDQSHVVFRSNGAVSCCVAQLCISLILCCGVMEQSCIVFRCNVVVSSCVRQ